MLLQSLFEPREDVLFISTCLSQLFIHAGFALLCVLELLAMLPRGVGQIVQNLRLFSWIEVHLQAVPQLFFPLLVLSFKDSQAGSHKCKFFLMDWCQLEASSIGLKTVADLPRFLQICPHVQGHQVLLGQEDTLWVLRSFLRDIHRYLKVLFALRVFLIEKAHMCQLLDQLEVRGARLLTCRLD